MNPSTDKFDPELGDLTGPDFTGMSEDEIITYWRNTTIAQRLHEVERLRRLKWGRKALGPMDKTKIKVVPIDWK
jgi:hypothetical protein